MILIHFMLFHENIKLKLKDYVKKKKKILFTIKSLFC